VDGFQRGALSPLSSAVVRAGVRCRRKRKRPNEKADALSGNRDLHSTISATVDALEGAFIGAEFMAHRTTGIGQIEIAETLASSASSALATCDTCHNDNQRRPYSNPAAKSLWALAWSPVHHGSNSTTSTTCRTLVEGGSLSCAIRSPCPGTRLCSPCAWTDVHRSAAPSFSRIHKAGLVLPPGSASVIGG